MFRGISESTLDKVYDWLDLTYYSPNPNWGERDNGPERRRNRLYAIHALNDMRALYAGVGNNGWWDEDRVCYLEELRDIIPYSMEQVLEQNEEIRQYDIRHEEAVESHEKYEGRSWRDCDEAIFIENHAPEIVKMQGNKDGRLYEYTKELFWDSVEWFMKWHGWWQEKKELREILDADKVTQRKRPKSARKVTN
tara:strand:- start:1593 stop:2174 length:582 start_codon:yes stop_codon:yes gene_type:complete